MGKVFRTSEETQEGSALLGHMVADRAAKHGIRRFEGIEHGTDRDWSLHLEDDFVIDVSECTKRWREDDSDHWFTWVILTCGWANGTREKKSRPKNNNGATHAAPLAISAY
jgi:hypothetical protein